MGPFQWVRTIVFFIVLSQGLVRNTMLQTCLNITGPGSNGKSMFVRMLTKLLGDKVCFVHANELFSSNETQQQGVGLEEAIFLQDYETERLPSANFKSFVADNAPILKRKLYKCSVGRETENHSSFISCSNAPLKYTSAIFNPREDYDYAFVRRVTLIHLYNILGTNEKSENTNGLLDSLFRTEGFDLNNEQTSQEIIIGLMYYMLDVLHVFDLPNLNSSSHGIIISPMSTTRMLSRENFDPLDTLLKDYIPVDEITTDPEDVENQTTVDFNNFISKKYSKPPSFSIQHVCDLFKRYLGIDYIKEIFDTDIVADAEVKYLLKGLKRKRGLDQQEFDVYENPNKFYDCSDLPPDMPAVDFVNFYIPLGHRYDFAKDIKESVFSTVKKLLLNQPIVPLSKPCISDNYKDITLRKMLYENDF